MIAVWEARKLALLAQAEEIAAAQTARIRSAASGIENSPTARSRPSWAPPSGSTTDRCRGSSDSRARCAVVSRRRSMRWAEAPSHRRMHVLSSRRAVRSRMSRPGTRSNARCWSARSARPRPGARLRAVPGRAARPRAPAGSAHSGAGRSLRLRDRSSRRDGIAHDDRPRTRSTRCLRSPDRPGREHPGGGRCGSARRGRRTSVVRRRGSRRGAGTRYADARADPSRPRSRPASHGSAAHRSHLPGAARGPRGDPCAHPGHDSRDDPRRGDRGGAELAGGSPVDPETARILAGTAPDGIASSRTR